MHINIYIYINIHTVHIYIYIHLSLFSLLYIYMYIHSSLFAYEYRLHILFLFMGNMWVQNDVLNGWKSGSTWWIVCRCRCTLMCIYIYFFFWVSGDLCGKRSLDFYLPPITTCTLYMQRWISEDEDGGTLEVKDTYTRFFHGDIIAYQPVVMTPFECQVGMMLQEVGAEYGTTTGRRRRCGWLDLVALPAFHDAVGVRHELLWDWMGCMIGRYWERSIQAKTFPTGILAPWGFGEVFRLGQWLWILAAKGLLRYIWCFVAYQKGILKRLSYRVLWLWRFK